MQTTIEQFDSAIQDIKTKIGTTQTAIANQEESIDGLNRELAGLDAEVASLDDIEAVEACLKKCRERREKIEVEQKQSEIRLRAYTKTLQNNKVELEDAIEERRLVLKEEYEQKILAGLKVINQQREELEIKLADFDDLMGRAECECRTDKGTTQQVKNNSFKPQPETLLANARLPYIFFDKSRKNVQYSFFRDRYNYFLKELKRSGDADNWIF